MHFFVLADTLAYIFSKCRVRYAGYSFLWLEGDLIGSRALVSPYALRMDFIVLTLFNVFSSFRHDVWSRPNLILLY